MSSNDDFYFFNKRTPGHTYFTSVFNWRGHAEKLRHVRMVITGSDELHVGQIDGAVCLRLTGTVRKNQVTALVSQDTGGVKRLSFHTFKTAKDGFRTTEEHEFTFRTDEWERLKNFLRQIEFVDLSNENAFQIEDISTQNGKKALVDASDASIIHAVKGLTGKEREELLRNLQGSLNAEEINTLLGRKQGLDLFQRQLAAGDWREKDWQEFFDREQWVFGYGLDYQIMGIFDREMIVGGGGTDNRHKPTVDFLGEAANYTVLVEIKTPETPIFKPRAGGRAGTWDFTPEFVSAVSQILEQKAEWVATAQAGEHYSKDGSRRLVSRTRSPRAILVIGSSSEFDPTSSPRDAQVKLDTFELFRRDTRGIDIMTYDELIERAQFITKNAR